ncbi:competence/damage-inducible protein A [Halapricum desulfuricans]|uniref:Putative nucleotide-utilizing enzyme related tomolybdopterin-biosynthesis enzyme MoeA n=1 Tax=Halapricum desulfuricans TaxID=2841257 RepID=A0A897N0U0_9EURY|nr:molybdopterin-binding protein [Halapricum desulfuricans]QSG06317.1 putative nucleotide-utilizing enzyme related tomolybdopterin-biosynthesis enzyme MoeA [Halapricum desulfuricans]
MRVALVTVGDELLAGDTVNTNAAWLSRKLTDRGVTVERVTAVPDRIGEIARVVNEYRAEYDAVVVTGGIGPTHDDVTMDAVAAAVGQPMEHSEAALEYIETQRGYAREDLTEGTTEIPAGGQFIPNPEGVAPGCHVENVYVLPGVPEEMRGMFGEIADQFGGTVKHTETVVADEPESALLDRIDDLRERFDVTVGVYPGEHVRVKVSGTDVETVESAARWLAERVDRPDDQSR